MKKKEVGMRGEEDDVWKKNYRKELEEKAYILLER